MFSYLPFSICFSTWWKKKHENGRWWRMHLVRQYGLFLGWVWRFVTARVLLHVIDNKKANDCNDNHPLPDTINIIYPWNKHPIPVCLMGARLPFPIEASAVMGVTLHSPKSTERQTKHPYIFDDSRRFRGRGETREDRVRGNWDFP